MLTTGDIARLFGQLAETIGAPSPLGAHRQPIHEPLALRELIERDELVGRVRLRDVPRSADHGRDPDLLEQAGLGTVRDLAGLVVARELPG